MSEPRLGQLQRQTQTLQIAPQMRQALKVLQVPTLELRSTILEELQTNPALEELPSGDLSQTPTEASSAEESMTDGDEGFEDFVSSPRENDSAEAAERRQYFLDSIASEESLQEYLMGQAKLAEASPEVLKALEYLIGNLDDRGFLSVEIGVVTEQSGQTLDIVERALNLLKNLDPPGLGSRDLQECLLHQLTLKGRRESLAGLILEGHFTLFLRRRVQELAKELGVDPIDIERALDEIAELDPAPGRRFADDTNRVVVPDVRVWKEGGAWKIELTRDYLPRLHLSANFKSYLTDKRLSSAERSFLQEKLKSGRQLISAIEQRQQTIERISRLLLEIQSGFFEEGVEKLKPLTMAQIAKKIEVHETTISRAVANKYIATPHGIFPLKFFFNAGYTSAEGEEVANASIKDRIATLIAGENPTKPLSDQKLVEMLQEENITLARRTVAKYREELHILPTHLRRQF
jgi:RNA polymerase sigma-54 factor